MPRLIRNDGITVRVKTQIFTNFVFERDSTVELQYYNTFKPTKDNSGYVTSNNFSVDYFSEYVDTISTISVDLTYSTQGFKEKVDIISFDTNHQTNIVEDIWNSLKVLEQKTSDFKSLFETILKISDSIKSNNNSNEFLSTGLARDIIQQYVLEYHKSENMVDGQVLPFTRLQYITDRIAEYGPEVLAKSRNYVLDINNKISYIDKLLSDSGEFILSGENSQFVKSNIDNLVRIASVSSSYGEFIDSVSSVFYEPNGNNSVNSQLNEYVHLFKDYVSRGVSSTNILGETILGGTTSVGVLGETILGGTVSAGLLGEWKSDDNSLILKPAEYIDINTDELIASNGVVVYTENKVHKNLSDSIYTRLNDISGFDRNVLISDKDKVYKDLNTNYDFYGANTLVLTQPLKTNRLLGQKIIRGTVHKVLDYSEEVEIFPTRTNLEFGNLNLIEENSYYKTDTQTGYNYETSDNIYTISGRNKTFLKEPYLKIEIGSSGLDDTTYADVTQNITIDGTLSTFNTPRSYRLTRLKKVDSRWAIHSSNSYDVYGDNIQANLALLYLTNFDDGDMLVLTTWDEPQNNKNVFEAVLTNDFGSTLQNSSDWSFRCSYQLVSIKGQGPILEEIKPVGSATGIENTVTWSESFGLPQSNMISPYGDTEFLNVTENNDGYMILGDVYRSTASLPFLYTKSGDSLQNSPDYIQFLYNASELLEIRDINNNIIPNRLIVKLYSWTISNNDINSALSSVNTNFYNKSSHNLLQTYYIDYSTISGWTEYSIDLNNLFDAEPIGHQQILWLEYEREPTLPYNPFEGGVDSQQIFDTWTRISHNSTGNYPASSSETNAWQLSPTGDIQCTINSGTYIGFVSPEPVGGYVLDTIMTSSNTDNDMVSLVLGYFEENGVQHTLNFARIRTGMFFNSTWAIGTNFGQSYGFGGASTGFTPSGALDFLNYGVIPGETGGGWSGLQTRVRVSKDPLTNIITVEATPFGTTGDSDFVTVATVDLNSNTYLQKFSTSSFGFSAWSQNASSWTNISFEQTYVFPPETAEYGNIGIGGISLQNNFINPETFINNVYKYINFPDKVEDVYESEPPIYLSKPNDILNTPNLYLQKPDDSTLFKNLFLKIPSDKTLIDKSYISQPSDKSISKKLFIGPPTDKIVHINNFFEKISRLHEPKGNYFSEEYSFVYSTKFAEPKLKDYVYNMNPYYGEDVDKTYLNKLFYVDLDEFTSPHGLIPYLYKPGDVFFVPDTHYVKTKNDNTQSLNIFEKRMDLYELHGGRTLVTTPINLYELHGGKSLNTTLIFYDRNSSLYGGMYYDYDTVPEFAYSGEFVGVSFYNATKEWVIPHFKIQSGHPRSGGSEAYGHDVIGISRVEPNHKVLPFFGLVKESDVLPAGRHGRSIDQEYRVTQNVSGRNNPTGLLYEFEEVYHDMDLDSGGIGEGKYNFNYEVIEGQGRIPDCLKLDQQRYIIGQIKESDAFIKKYYYESWIKDQGHYGTLDENYDDFEMIDPRVFKTGVLGIASTRGSIDLIIEYPDLNGFRYEIGDTIRQNLATATITDIIEEYKTPIDLGDGFGEIERTVVKYELQNVNGEFEELTKTVQYSFDAKSSREELEIKIANLQTELSTTDPASSRYAELVEQIASLNEELNIIGDYTFLVVTGTSVSYDITQVENQRGLNLKVYRTEINTARGLRKFVDLIFTVYNNWSYDRDKFLYSSDRLPDKLYYKGEYLDRDVWVDKMRSDGFFRFNNEENNISINELIESFKLDYKNGVLNLSENEYNEQLEIYNAMLSLGNTPNEVEYLENIEPFTLNCEIPLSEKDFYELSTETRIIRGYPVYASCN